MFTTYVVLANQFSLLLFISCPDSIQSSHIIILSHSSNMCSSKHKKPVCDKCTAGTNCTKCCMCQPRSRGRAVDRERRIAFHPIVKLFKPLPRSNPERRARIHPDALAPASAADDVTPSTTTFVSDDHSQHVSGSQAQILKVLEVMNCEDGYESSVLESWGVY